MAARIRVASPFSDEYGLAVALKAYAEPFFARLGVPVRIEGGEAFPRLPPVTETALFHIVQEALANVAKHARAKQVEIALTREGDRLSVAVDDDGVGFPSGDGAATATSWGVQIMRERAQAIGATLTIDSARGRGTRVTVELQIPPKPPFEKGGSSGTPFVKGGRE